MGQEGTTATNAGVGKPYDRNTKLKPLTKRQRANLLRAAARFFEENPDKWTRLYLHYEGSFCALGRLYYERTGQIPPESTKSYDPPYRNADIVLSGGLIGYVVSESWTPDKGSYYWHINDSESEVPDVKTVIKHLRKMARALDRGAN